jgi:hypothetical protein
LLKANLQPCLVHKWVHPPNIMTTPPISSHKLITPIPLNLKERGIGYWHAPKFLVRPKLGLSYSIAELWGTLGTFPTLSTRRGRGACWSSRIGLRRVTSFTYLLEPASNQLTSGLVHFLERPWC